MISHQELSGQQVSMYLMDFEDHFTSHSFRKLYWTSFESYLNQQEPSPECYVSKSDNTTEESANSPIDDTTTDAEHEEEPDDESTGCSTQNSEEDEVAEDEVIITSDGKGDLMAHASQVSDYCLRSSQYKNLTLWDFIAQIDKVNKLTQKNKRENLFDSESYSDSKESNECDASEENDFSENVCEQPDLPLTVKEMRKLLHSRSRTRPKCELQEKHPKSDSQCLQIRKHSLRFVTVVTGSPGASVAIA
jgi:hypothetical protein